MRIGCSILTLVPLTSSQCQATNGRRRFTLSASARALSLATGRSSLRQASTWRWVCLPTTVSVKIARLQSGDYGVLYKQYQ